VEGSVAKSMLKWFNDRGGSPEENHTMIQIKCLKRKGGNGSARGGIRGEM
jgi:hypothetical protein